MSTTNDIALVSSIDTNLRTLPSRPVSALPTPDEVRGLQAYGEMIVQSRLFSNVTSWQSGIMIARYGQQLGIDEFTALTQIYWIKGVPTCSAQLMNALITRDHGGDAIHPVESTPKVCRISYKRKEWTDRREVEYRIEDVPNGLKAGSDAWKNYPADMLFARLISRIARQSFPDTVRGLYTKDEIEDSRAIEVQATVTPSPSAQAIRPVPKAAKVLNRGQEAKDLINAIIGTFAIDPEGAKQIGEDLICLRFGLDQTADATAEQLREVREAVMSWQQESLTYATEMLAHLRMVGSAETATMARDVEQLFTDQAVNDPFVLGALIDRLDVLELGERRTAQINKTIDAVSMPS